MRITAGSIVLAFTLGLAGAAHAQNATAEASAAAEAESRDPDARIESALSTALEAGIPVSLLESKIAEGRAKGVPLDRIAAAVEARLSGLLRASEVLDGARLRSVTNADLVVAADALEVGVNASSIVRMARSAPDDRRTVAIAVLADLVQLGMASESAAARVDAALARGPEALVNLHAESAASLRARGAGPGAGAGVDIGLGVGVGGRNH